jgi:hypothetical protein
MRGRTSIVALAFTAFLLAAGTAQARDLPDLTPPGHDGLGRALADGRLTEAEYALERALAIYQPERARRLFGEVSRPEPREGTLILRDLAARLGSLPPAKRRVAERILARPTDRADAIHGYRTGGARKTCDPRMCFWWVTRTRDAPSLRDANRNRVPDWVDRTRAVFRNVWATEVGLLRYRRPRSDLSSRNDGGSRKLDVYVADVGQQGLYGYCTTDDPRRRTSRAVSAYCVVDDDFARSQFEGSATGLRALKVTAAHEFFHAVQFAFDWLEDLWLMEGTATWIEDEVYDGVNDNLQYLRTSPISERLFYLSLDYYNPDPSEVDANYKYGVWIFWRYLSERFGRDIVREIWQEAGAGTYSARAVVITLAERGVPFPDLFTDFGVANFYPEASYSEGSTYPSPQLGRTLVGPSGVPTATIPMPHLSTDYYAFVPSGLPPTATLTFTLDLPPAVASPRATALVEQADGTVLRIAATFNVTTGRWVITVPAFGSAVRVILVLTNASTRFQCFRGTVFSCHGRPLDEVNFRYEASVS